MTTSDGFRFDGKAAAILSIGLITILAGMAVSPALAGIKTAFPDHDDSVIQMVLTVPALCVVPGCLICDRLVSRFGSRTTLVMGLILYLVGGVFAGVMPDFTLMIVMRAVLGIGIGILTPLAQILISENYTGSVRDRLVGIPASASFLTGFLSAFIVGNIAAIDWRLTFAVYLVGVPELFLVLRYLPDQGRPAGVERGGPWDPRNRGAWALVLTMLFVNIAFYTFSTSIALFMKSEGIGDDATSGYVVSLFMLAGFISGVLSARMRARLGRITIAVALGLMACGFAVMSVSQGVPELMLAGILIGWGDLIVYSDLFAGIRLRAKGGNDERTWISVMTAAMFGGQAISATVVSASAWVLGITGYRGTFAMLAVALVLGVAVSLLSSISRGHDVWHPDA
ncbi:MAG: MFS transporter [Candidatus Methanomethylophilaceae archaeon]